MAWGYHFENADHCKNSHFINLVRDGVIFSGSDQPPLIERFAWMGGSGQWGIPGWSMPDGCVSVILDRAKAFAGRRVLEIGTSRGRVTAMLASIGCNVTTIDRHDRGAGQNLGGLNVRIVIDNALNFLETTSDSFDLIVVDLHGNSVADWTQFDPLLKRCLSSNGMLLLNNASLWKIPEWHEERGVRWFLDKLLPPWKYEVHDDTLPGVAVVTH
jgi:predicted O-methyltransferase YrrM